jgi:hypothetical protein
MATNLVSASYTMAMVFSQSSNGAGSKNRLEFSILVSMATSVIL